MSEKGLCLRCNYAYATTTDDNMPVCDDCKQKFNAEEIRTCPVDQEKMKKILVKNVMIDKCPSCHGIWLDGDEVDLLGNIANGAVEGEWANREKMENDGTGKTGRGKFWKGFILGAILS